LGGPCGLGFREERKPDLDLGGMGICSFFGD